MYFHNNIFKIIIVDTYKKADEYLENLLRDNAYDCSSSGGTVPSLSKKTPIETSSSSDEESQVSGLRNLADNPVNDSSSYHLSPTSEQILANIPVTQAFILPPLSSNQQVSGSNGKQ